jgi:hypothetical protein
MTRREALAEAERKQAECPEATWMAAQRDGEWVVARVGLKPSPIKPTGTATRPPPPAPYEGGRQSELQRVVTQYGSGG